MIIYNADSNKSEVALGLIYDLLIDIYLEATTKEEGDNYGN